MENQKVFRMGCNKVNINSSLSGKSILMLNLIAESSKKGWLGITKLQKLSFLTEYYLSQQGLRASGDEFFMYDHGPISKGVYDDLALLLNEEIVIDDESGIQTSEAGANLAEQFTNTIPKEIQTVMQSVVKRFAHWSTNDLTNFVHNMKVTLPNGEIAKVDDLDRGCVVLEESAKSFKVDNNILETFKIMSNSSMIKAIRSARKSGSKSSPYNPLVS